MKKITFLLAIVPNLFFIQPFYAQEQPAATLSTEELLKRIEKLEAENSKKKEWDINFYGWVRTEYHYDSRQSAYSRELMLNLYPLDKKLDANGEDINAANGSNFLAIASRLGTRIKGPDVWGAKASANIEGDFFGNTELNRTSAGTVAIGLFRLRHATATLAWPKTAVTFGQTWYPEFVTEVFPGTVNFNTGIMFNPFGWAGQIKLVQNITPELSLIAVAYKDREFQAPTAAGGFLNSGTINSSMPALHGQLQYKTKSIVAGAGAEYQSLKPVIESNGLASSYKVNSTAFLAYVKITNELLTAKLYGITGGNLHHFVMLGGFGGYPEGNGQESYRPTKTSAAWLDVSGNNPLISPGLFLGYTKNSGLEEGYKNLYFRGSAGNRVLDNVWRASARVEFKQNKFNIAPELEYTGATWGDLQKDGTAGGNEAKVGNFRTTVRVMYSF